MTVNRDPAAVERVRFLILFAGVIAAGRKIVGMLIVVVLVIIPAEAARRVSATPDQMAVAASIIGIVAGLFGSPERDVHAGPAFVLAASIALAANLLIPRRGRQGRISRRLPG